MAVVKNSKLHSSEVVIVDEKEEEIPVEIINIFEEEKVDVVCDVVAQSNSFDEFMSKQIQEDIDKEDVIVEKKAQKGRKKKVK